MLTVKKADTLTVELQNVDALPLPGQLATGDYYLRCGKPSGRGDKLISERNLIVGNTSGLIMLRPDQPFEFPPEPGSVVEIQVRLQRPQVDLKLCIGCGVCEHECPVSGRKAIRITAENESRSKSHSLLL